MISNTVKYYVRNAQVSLIQNYEEAACDTAMWECHHRLEIQEDGTELSSKQLKSMGLYWYRPPEELIFLRRKEHRKLHETTKLRMKSHEQTKKKVLEKETRISWIDKFRGMNKDEILKFIEKSKLSVGVKHSLRKRFVYNTPQSYTRVKKERNVRIRKNWNNMLEGKTRQEIIDIIDKECEDCGLRSRLRKKYGVILTKEESDERKLHGVRMNSDTNGN